MFYLQSLFPFLKLKIFTIIYVTTILKGLRKNGYSLLGKGIVSNISTLHAVLVEA